MALTCGLSYVMIVFRVLQLVAGGADTLIGAWEGMFELICPIDYPFYGSD